MSKIFNYIKTIILVLVSVFAINWLIKTAYEREKELKECYFQSPKSPECEYMIWKYENRNKNSDVIMINGRI